MTLETLILSVAALAALEIAYLVYKRTETKLAGGPSQWSTEIDAFSFFEASETDKAASRMKDDFDLARAKSIMGIASQFADKKIEL
jgi:hypothetical protein